MHVLVTGGAGFIGSHLVEYHLARGDRVHALDDLSTGHLANLDSFMGNTAFRFDQADILAWPELEKAVAWADRVYHLAALVGVFRVLAEPVQVMEVNIAGSERVLRAAHAGKWRPQVVMASTSEVYGHGVRCEASEEPGGGMTCGPTRDFREDDDLIMSADKSLRWNYSISKLADEAFSLAYAQKHGLPVTVVRFFNTIGPRQTGKYGMVVPRFIGQALDGKALTVFGDGSQRRSFCDVRDTVAALDLLAANPASQGEVVNVGNRQEISIRELAELIIARSGGSSTLEFIPYKQAYGEVFDEIYHRRPCLEKFKRLSGYRHRWTLEQTIDDLIGRSRRERV